MNDDEKTREQLEHDLAELRSQNAALKESIVGNMSADLAIEVARLYAENISETVREPVLVLDGDLKIVSANSNFYRTFKVTPDETIGSFIYDLGNRQWDIPRLRELLEEIIPKKETFDDFEVVHDFRDIGRKIMLLNARRIYRKDIGAQMILLAIEDITEHKKIEKTLAVTEAKYQEIVQNANSIILRMDPDGKVTFFNEFAQRFFGYTEEEMLGRSLVDTIVPETEPTGRDLGSMIKDIGTNPEEYINNENENVRRNGERVWIAWTNRAIRDESGHVTEILCIGNDITEHKLLESLLSESEERYRRLFETAKDGIVLLEKNKGHITHMNPAAEKMFGYSSKECLGKGLQDIGVMLDMGDFQTVMQDLNKNGIMNYTDVPVKTNHGLHIETDIYLVDRARLAQCNIRNVTERNLAEASLKASETRYRKLYDSMRDAFVSVDMEGHIRDCNESYLNMLGYSSEEIQNLTSEDITPEEWHSFEQIIVEQQIIPKGYSEIYEKEYKKKDGTIFPVELRMFLIRDNEDNPSGMWAIVRDISERKKADDALLASEEKYRLLVENANEAIFVAQDANIKFCNPKTLDLFGFSQEEILSNPFIHFIHTEDRDMVLEQHQRRMRGEVLPSIYSFRIIDKAENIKWVEVNAVLFSWEGRPATLNFLSDITERKRAGEEKEKLEAQFLQAQKMEAVGQLAGGVAHDFNNLLTPILGYSEILLEGLHEDDPRYREISLILQAAESAKTLTRQLLAFSRQQVLDMMPVDLSRVLTDFKKIIRRTIREDIDIRIRPNSRSAFVRADVGQIEQIIMNLAVNAQDAMPRGGVLTLTTEELTLDETYLTGHPEASPGRYVMLEVSDTGEGMDSELIGHIFEPFFTTKETGKGTGLGLSTVYGIVKQHSGFINVYSEPGKGTSFRIYLPHSGVKSEILKKPKKKMVEEDPDGSETILVVEDNDLVRDLASDILRKQGYMVISAKDAQECLAVLAAYDDKIDLLLTDVIMPDMNGKELYDNVSLTLPDLPVIYMSGYTEDVIARHGVLEKGVNLIHKPFTKKNLTAKVREVLDQ